MPAKFWIDQSKMRRRLSEFFDDKRDDLQRFGQTVNQTFEAYTLASVVHWYKKRGWHAAFMHPGLPARRGELPTGERALRLKFSTRGRPDNYTYVVCRKGSEAVQIRHQLRVSTAFYEGDEWPRANICLDVAIIRDCDLSKFDTSDHLPNKDLVSFAEAKHMSAFAELLASFIGMVHELQPARLGAIRRSPNKEGHGPDHPAPFLYVSGRLLPTALGILNTIRVRGYDIDVFDHEDQTLGDEPLPIMAPPPTSA